MTTIAVDHLRATHHWKRAVSLDIPGLRLKMRFVEGFNAKFAVLVTHVVGTMGCAYVFTLLALAGLPTALSPGGSGIVSWIAQTFLQLVLLSIIMVGQQVQSNVSETRAIKQFEDTELLLTEVKALRVEVAELRAAR